MSPKVVPGAIIYGHMSPYAKPGRDINKYARSFEAVRLRAGTQTAAPPLHQLAKPRTKTTTIASLTTVLYITLYLPTTRT